MDKKTASKLAVKTKDKDNPGMKNKNLVESIHLVSRWQMVKVQWNIKKIENFTTL